MKGKKFSVILIFVFLFNFLSVKPVKAADNIPLSTKASVYVAAFSILSMKAAWTKFGNDASNVLKMPVSYCVDLYKKHATKSQILALNAKADSGGTVSVSEMQSLGLDIPLTKIADSITYQSTYDGDTVTYDFPRNYNSTLVPLITGGFSAYGVSQYSLEWHTLRGTYNNSVEHFVVNSTGTDYVVIYELKYNHGSGVICTRGFSSVTGSIYGWSHQLGYLGHGCFNDGGSGSGDSTQCMPVDGSSIWNGFTTNWDWTFTAPDNVTTVTDLASTCRAINNLVQDGMINDITGSTALKNDLTDTGVYIPSVVSVPQDVTDYTQVTEEKVIASNPSISTQDGTSTAESLVKVATSTTDTTAGTTTVSNAASTTTTTTGTTTTSAEETGFWTGVLGYLKSILDKLTTGFQDVINGISTWGSSIVKGIETAAANLGAALTAGVSAISTSISNLLDWTISTDVPKINFVPLEVAIDKKFPFCIPFDMVDSFRGFKADRLPPSFDISIPGFTGLGSFTPSVTKYDFKWDWANMQGSGTNLEILACILRFFIYFFFVFFLITKTRELIKG